MVKYIKCAIAFFLVVMLAGCGKDQGDEAVISNTQTTEKEPVILTYGYIDEYSFQDLDSSINERIVSFNKSQDDYYIEVIKYGEDSYTDGLNALNSDIAAGKGPDIMEIPDRSLLEQLGRKGVLEDLYPYLDDGTWPQREDFVDNILPCFERDGKLYGLIPFFTISSVIGNPDYISREQITFDQLKDLYEENRENDDIIVYNGLNRNYILWYCINTSLEEFVDLEDLSCDFQNEDFQRLLEFSAQFDDMGMMGSDTVDSYVSWIDNRLCLLSDGPISGFQDYTGYRGMSGKENLLVGFPSISGCSPQIGTNSSFLAINSDSDHKDAAWQFLCTFLDDRYLTKDENLRPGFPITKSAFEWSAQKAMTANQSGGEVSYTNTKGETVTYPLPPTSEEEVRYIKEIIKQAAPSPDYGEIEGIIGEEIQNYWNGTKDVEGVMEVIQNRVGLYLDEL